MCYAPANARPAFSIANSTSLQGFMSTGAWAERSRYGLRFSACFFPRSAPGDVWNSLQ
jgi:hypothetical protein